MGNSSSSRSNRYHSSRSKMSKKRSHQKLTNSELTRHQQNDPSLNFNRPKNIQDIDRMQIQHFLFQHIWNCSFSPPIERVLRSGSAKVLDVGCGPGTWLLENATNYPQADFYGIDIARVYPLEIKPTNLEFIQSDLTRGIKFHDNYFDFVRMSMMSSYLPEDKWERIVSDLIRVLKPGGYIEIMELEMQFYNVGPKFDYLTSRLTEFISSTGANAQVTQKLDSFLTSASTTPLHSVLSSRGTSIVSESTSCTNLTDRIQLPTNHFIYPHQGQSFSNPFINSLSKLSNIQSEAKKISIGNTYGGKTGKIYEELLMMYYENTVVDILPRHMKISKETYLELWKACREEFKVYSSYTNLCKFWGMKIVE